MIMARERLSTAEAALPELMAMQRKNEEKVTVAYYEGFDGVREMYRLLTENMEKKALSNRFFVAFYAHQKDTPGFLKKYWRELNEEYVKFGIKRKAVTTFHPSIKYYLEEETRNRLGMDLRPLLEKDYSSNVSIEVYDNFTQIISHRNLQGILIDNSDIADVVRQIFNLVWQSTNRK
jgi:hypothetical protein